MARPHHDPDCWGLSGALHDDWRGRLRNMDGISADDRDDVRLVRSVWSGTLAAAAWSQSTGSRESGSGCRPAAHAGTAIQLERPLQHLEWIAGRNVSGARLFRMRPESSAALSHRQVTEGQPYEPAVQRGGEDTAANVHPLYRCYRFLLLQLPKAAGGFRSKRHAANGGELGLWTNCAALRCCL